jgi:preprotein translocase subunit SecG
MNLLETALLIVHVAIAAVICGLVLLQHGKGADMGAAFGSGASGSLFGAAGSANFLSRTTAVLAAVFFVTSVALTWYATTHKSPDGVMGRSGSVLDRAKPAPKAGDAPAAPKETPASAPAAGSKAGEVPK